MGRRSNKEIIEEQHETIRQLFGAYTFLLCSVIIFLCSLNNFVIDFQGTQLSLMSILFPFVYFISGVITKEIGYKYGMQAVIISSIVIFSFYLVFNATLTGDFYLINSLGVAIAYLFSQSVCLAIYNYLLVNTKFPIIAVIIVYIFSLLVNNMICMLFNSNMIFSDSFWLEYLLLVGIQSIWTVILSICDSIVERGID